MATTYILRCVDNRYYIGSSNDFNHRFIEHKMGKCKFTKSRLPVTLVYSEEFTSYSLARKREYKIKSYKSRKYIEKLIKSRQQGPII
jgi:putative endonuclease